MRFEEAKTVDLFSVIEKRRSIRKYKADPVSNEDLKKILEAGHLAPSGSNRQPWPFVVVKERQAKEALAIASSNQGFIAEAFAVVVILSDPTVYPKPSPQSGRIGYKQDPMIAIEHMALAGAALGYGTCWIGAFNESEVKKIIRAPENLTAVALLPIGVPNEDPPARPRKSLAEIAYSETYGARLDF